MKVFGLISDDRVLRSKSPAMHSHVLEVAGYNGVYLPFNVKPENLKDAISGLRALGIAGVNVTVPYKEKVIPYLDRLSEEAAAIGAVNTIVREGNNLVGRNTDAGGFESALEEAGFRAEGCRAIIIGAGGAAKAVLFSLNRLGAESIVLVGRDMVKTSHMAETMNAKPASIKSLADHPVKADIIINATTASDPAEAPELADIAGRLKLVGCRLIFDLNYGREINFWRDLGREHGVYFMDGLSMLAHQARLSFKYWTGLDVDVTHFKKTL